MNVLKTFINCSLGQSFYRLIITKDENVKSKICNYKAYESNINRFNINEFKNYKSEVYNTVDLYNKFDPYNKFNLYNKNDLYKLYKKDLWQWS